MKNNFKKILIQIKIDSDLNKVWHSWNTSTEIIKWYTGHNTWRTTEVENPIVVGEQFCFTMMALNGKSSFLFKGKYLCVDTHKCLLYIMEDGRKVKTMFQRKNTSVVLTSEIEIESKNSTESQAIWWKTILCNFKKHVEKGIQ